MIKPKILVLFVILGLFLTACTTNNAPTSGGAYRGGTLGVVAVFEPISILEDGIYTIFDTEDFPLDVIITNKGEENIAAGDVKLTLKGPAKDQFENIPSWELNNRQIIDKVSEFNPNGGEEVISFTPNVRAKFKEAVTGFMDINWNLETQYKYQTHLIINDVCFKGDVTDLTICNVKEKKIFSVSGAPITVTAVSEDNAGKGVIMLKIDIKNAGTGTSTLIGKDFDTRFEQVGYIIDEQDKWECKSSGRDNEARLTAGTAQILCRLKTPLAEEDVYVKTVKFDLQYVYKDMIQQKLRVKESVE